MPWAAMGLHSSPYQAVKSMHFAEEVIRGDPMDTTNVIHWDKVRLNLPGQDDALGLQSKGTR